MLVFFKLAGWQHLLLDMLLSVPIFMNTLSMAITINSVLQPTMGRTPNGEPDYIIGGMNLFFSLYCLIPLSGLELLFSRKHWGWVAGGLSAVCIVIMFIPFNPYMDEVAVQRHNWVHSEIVTYNQNGTITDRLSGVLITKWDVNNIQAARSALRDSGLSEIQISQYCDRDVYCNMPLFRPRLGNALKQSLFYSMEPPAYFEHSLSVTNRTCQGDKCVLHFLMRGPPHNTFRITPHTDIQLSSWSFSSPVQPSIHFKEHPIYIVVHSTATYSTDISSFAFSLTFIVPPPLQKGVITSISHDAFKIQHPEDQTPMFRNLIQSAPDYFNIAPTIAFKSNYVF